MRLRTLRPNRVESSVVWRGADLRGHLDLWDTLLRDGWFVSGTGVSDDHQGEHGTWTKTKNHYATGAWTAQLDEVSLVSAIGGGRVYCSELGAGTSIDLSASAGAVRMGQVLVDGSASSTVLDVLVQGLPAGGFVRVVQGGVDFGGAALDPSSATVVTLPASSFSGGAPR